MKTIFVDTNILLDVLLHREEFMRPAAAIWEACEIKKSTGFVSAISVNNIHYVCAKYLGRQKALEAVRLVLAIFEVVSLDEKILRLSADSPGKDFEDAVQLYSALQAGTFCIVTRNVRDFPSGFTRVLSPEEFFALP